MPDMDDDFSSLFDDDKKTGKEKKSDDIQSLDGDLSSFIGEHSPESNELLKEDISDEDTGPGEPAERMQIPEKKEISLARKRSSQDFEPDMDAILLTAQSSMIIEGMKSLLRKDYTLRTLNIYSEAIRGIELYIKILDRNPANYKKLANIINQDIDCKEVEKIAFNIYESTYRDKTDSDEKRIKAYELFREGLRTGYIKVLLSKSMGDIKKYFLQSGALDEYKIKSQSQSGDREFKKEIEKLTELLKYAINLIKTGKGEIAKGMKGKDLNIYIVKVSEMLFYYNNISGNIKEANIYKRLMDNHKNYFVIR